MVCGSSRTSAVSRGGGRPRREAKAAFGKDEVYLEKLIRRARHVEVQILGDAHGNLVHLYSAIAPCSAATRRWWSARAVFLGDAARADLCEAALKIGRAVRYRGAGTVEFLQDVDTGKFYFIEVNPGSRWSIRSPNA